MTMKEQELKALEQIKKIVASLGEDSYIGTAFEGCFEIAESNINNDWACSMKQRVESLNKEVCSLSDMNRNLVIARDRATSALKGLQEENNQLSRKAKSLEEKVAKLTDAIEEKDAIILQLKAKLYDLRVG